MDLTTNLNSETTSTFDGITPTSDDDVNGGSGSGDNGNGSGDEGDGSGDGSGDGDNSNGSGSGDSENSGSGSGDGDNGENGSGDGSGDNNNGSGIDDGDGEGSGIDNGDGDGSGSGSGDGIDNGGNGNNSGDNDGSGGEENGSGGIDDGGSGDGSENGSGDDNGTGGNENDNIHTTALWDTTNDISDGKKSTTINYANFTTPNPSNNNSSDSTKNPNDSDGRFTTTVSNNNKFSTTLPDSNGSSGNNSQSKTSTTKSALTTTKNLFGQSTTRDPIVFDGYTQTELDQLITKFQLSVTASRIALESQTQDRMLSIVNDNINASYSLRDILISCAYNMVPCDYEKDFEQVADPDFGNCYTYNYNGKHSIVRAGKSQTQDRMLSIVNDNINASYSLRDILISCAYNMVPCDYEKDFEQVADPDFGNCYTYNYNGKHSIVRAGSNYGLKMIAFSNVSEYLETSSKSGMRVVVHKQNFAPFPNTEGINAAVGTYININVRYNNIQRLGEPYGNCHHENDTSEYIYDGFYTYEGCFRTCYQQQIINTCQCADPRFPRPKGSNISWCAVANATLFTCYENYLTTYGDFSNVSNCECHTGCNEPEYNLEVSSAVWPGNITNYTTPMCWGYYPNTKIDCFTAYKENAVFIDISFNRMVHEKTYERAAVTSMNLFHQISGAVALWTGVSMLIFAEMIEVLWFGIFRPNISPRVGSTDKISDISNRKKGSNNSTNIYDSNMAAEYANDVPQPFASHASGIGLI
uniref:Uncharacterized protein n=1 Tax=Panagrolaimus sp. ES5 TaxID=591445 RepID=A0AC34GVE7_9BILA